MSKSLVLMLLAAAVVASGCSTPPATDNTGAKSCDEVTLASLGKSTSNQTIVALATSKGCIVAELEDQKAPATVSNFRNYTQENFFDGVLFHRVIKDFMIQTGGMGPDGQFKTATHPPIVNEARTSGLKNVAYSLALARTSQPDSATNQFFINHKANTFLDATPSSAGYAVFGTVIDGRGVVDAIASVPVEAYAAGKHCQQDSQPSCPLTDVVLFSVRIVL